MRRFAGILQCMLLPIMAFAAPQEQLVKERMMRDLDSLHNTFASKYAPAEWKKTFADWDLETQIFQAKAQMSLMNPPSIKGYQKAIRTFLQSTKDYHVSVHFWSTEYATLPLRVSESTSGAYYVTAVDSSRLPEGVQISVGETLQEFDGRPVQDVIQEIKAIEIGDASPATDQGLAEIALTTRDGSSGMDVPNGPVTLTFLSRESGEPQTVELEWEYQWEFIKDPPLAALSPEDPRLAYNHGNHSFFKKKMTFPRYEHSLSRLPQLNSDPNALGEKTSYVPSLGRELWHSRNRDLFDAYIFVAPSGKLVGYLRIPHYSGGPEWTEEFGSVVDFMDRYTDALVIDQVNNPGGSVLYLYSLLAHLANEPLAVPTHRMTLTQEDVFFAIQNLYAVDGISSDYEARQVFGNTLDGYEVDLEFAQQMKKYFYFTIDEWNAGRLFTTPGYLYGIDAISPHRRERYTKPILLLVNHLCFSGGDFLPAILQDNQRATIMGTRTAGAGGYVNECTFANPFSLGSVSYTASIAERADSNPIENLGVTPDITYDLKEEDFLNGFSSFKDAILETVETLLNADG